jgi:hypothetical protein
LLNQWLVVVLVGALVLWFAIVISMLTGTTDAAPTSPATGIDARKDAPSGEPLRLRLRNDGTVEPLEPPRHELEPMRRDRRRSVDPAVAIMLIAPILLLTVVGAIIGFATWRCPACGRSPGSSFRLTFCSHCGARLQEDTKFGGGESSRRPDGKGNST